MSELLDTVTDHGQDGPDAHNDNVPAGHADDGHAEHGAHGSSGLSNNKLAMWLFLGSDCLLFGGLISTYMLYRGRVQRGPNRDTGGGMLRHRQSVLHRLRCAVVGLPRRWRVVEYELNGLSKPPGADV